MLGPTSTAAAWTCQLIRAELEGDELVLDLVDIDDDPFGSSGRPRGPFTLHLGGGDVSPDSHRVERWSANADVISVVSGRTGGVDWLSLVSSDDVLVVELSSEPH